MVPLPKGPAKFFRLSPDEREALGGFAVHRGEVRERLDAVYAGDMQLLADRYATPEFPLVEIGSIATKVQYGTSARSVSEEVGTPVLRIPNLQLDGWALDDLKYLELSERELTSYRLEIGDILFNRTNGSRDLVGKCEVFDFEGEWAFASYLIRLRLDQKKANPYFVSAFLNTKWGRRQVEHASRQILMSNINAEEIRALRIPLPKPDIQAALLAKLDAARAARDAGLAAAEAALDGLDSFVLDELGLTLPPEQNAIPFAIRYSDVVRSRFDSEYHSPRFRQLRSMIENGRFGAESLKDICLPLITGFAAGGDSQSDEVGGVPHLRPTNVTPGGEISLDSAKFVPQIAVGEINKIRVGEVLFNNTNSSLWVGKSAVFELDEMCACSNHMTRLRLRDPEHSPSFLAAFLNALRSIGYFSALATNFNNQSGINSETLGALRVPLPSADIQSAISSEVMRRKTEARKLRAEARADWSAARQAFEEALLGAAA